VKFFFLNFEQWDGEADSFFISEHERMKDKEKEKEETKNLDRRTDENPRRGVK